LSSSDRIRIRVRSGQNEAEIESEQSHLREAIELIPDIVSRFPAPRVEVRREQSPEAISSLAAPIQVVAQSTPLQLPAISVEKGDSLSDVISKFFADQWGKNPRRLSEVREVLQSYGLNYPKQSVAVALLRLAKASKIRRFKSEGGEYVYTASMSAMSAPSQILILPDTEDAAEPDVENPANV